MNLTVRLRSAPAVKLRFQPGATGSAGTITVNTVTTGAPGSAVVIQNVGTAQNAILNITIPRGDVGAQGDKGWAPILAVVTDGARRVLQLADWTGGQGTKPAAGSYLGAAGLVSDIASAVDIRGAQGLPGSVTIGDKGDILVSGTGDTWTIDADAVDNTKLANMATLRLKGRVSAGVGDPEDLTPGQARQALQITAQGEAIVLASDAATQRAAMSVAAQVASRTGAYSVVAGDYGKTFAASGTWAFGLPAAATATGDFWIELRNTGTGILTVTPSGSETVNAAASLKIYRGESVKLLSDGAGWHALFGRREVVLGGTGLSGIAAAVATIDESLPAEMIEFELTMQGVTPVAGNGALGLRFSLDGGATWASSGYQWFGEYLSASTSSSPAAYLYSGATNFGTTGVEATPGVLATSTLHNTFRIRIIPGRTGNLCPNVEGVTSIGSSAYWFSGGYYTAYGRATNVRLLFSGGGGNIAAGAQYTLIGKRPSL